MNTARTLNSVEKALGKMSMNTPSPKVGNDYLKCRYGSMPSSTVRVPDGVGRNLTTNDHLATYDVVAKGPFSVIVTPTFPQQGFVYCPTGSTVTMNSANVPPATSRTMASSTLSDFLFPVGASSTNDVGTAGRIISMRWKVTYTGAASTCQGLLQANSCPIRMDADPSICPSVITYDDNAGASQTLAANTILTATVDIADPKIPLTPNRNTIINRPEHGMHGFLRRNVGAKAHTFKPLWQQQVTLITDAIMPTLGVRSIFQSPKAGACIGVSNLDFDFDFERIDLVVASGVETSWRVEVVTCIEVEHPNNFRYIALTSSAAPVDERILHVDDMLNQAMVHAAPLSSTVLPATLPSEGRQKKPKRKRARRVNVKPRKPAPGRTAKSRAAGPHNGPIINNFK